MITLDEYENSLAGYYICDCVVRDRNKFAFVADSWYSDGQVEEEERNKWDPDFRPKLVLSFFRDREEGDRLGWMPFEQWGRIDGGAALNPLNQFVGIELQNKRVFITGSGENFEDAPLGKVESDSPLRGGIRKLKTLDGYLYLCGGNRSLGKRLGKAQWKSFHSNLPQPDDSASSLSFGFDDFDGFSETDIYAAGGRGDVWHFDGAKWRQIPFPTNTFIQTVCCGTDGKVYISCYEGMTFMGRDDRWKLIHDGGVNLGWRDMVWHEGRAWCTNDSGLWTIQGGKVEYCSDLPSEVRVCSGNLYTNDSVLLVAGLGGAAFLEGGKWEVIFLRARMEKALRDMGE